jgi:Spy/CpxP family protein refolding chaperone
MTSKPLLTLISAALLFSGPLHGSYAVAQAPPPGAPNAAPPPPADGATPSAPQSRRYQRQGPSQGSSDSGRGMGMHPGSRIVPPGEWWKNPDVIQKLSLTEDQQKKMDGIFQQSRLQLIDLKANLEKQEVLLEPMLNANPPDSAKTLAQIGKVADSRAELEKTNARMLLGIRSVLTADQWTKLQTRDGRGMPYNGKPDGNPGGGRQGHPGGGRDLYHPTPDTP